MKNFKIIHIYLAMLLMINFACMEVVPQSGSRGLPNTNPWFQQLSFSCKSQGYSISVLRRDLWEIGDSPYKIQLTYHSTLTEYCNKARRDVLANAHSASLLFSSAKISTNAQWGDYCNRNRQWIIGDVYQVVYPSSTSNSGPYTTNILHNSTVHLDVATINDLVVIFKKNSSFSVSTCNDPKCAVWDDNPKLPNDNPKYDPNERYFGSRDFNKKIKKLLSEDIRYIDLQPNSSRSNGGIVLPDISDPAFMQNQNQSLEKR